MLFRVMISVMMFFLIQSTVYGAEIRFITHNIEDKFYIDYSGEIRGKANSGRRAFQIELIREMMTIVGHQPKILEIFPFKRGLKTLLDNPNIAFFNVNRTADREDRVKWVGPLQSNVISLYEATNYPKGIKTLEEAKKVELICVLNGSNYADYLVDNGFTNMHLSNSHESCFRMLINGRVSLTIIADSGFLEVIKTTGTQKNAIKQSFDLFENRSYLAMSNNIPDTVVQEWQEALDRLKKTGRYNLLIQQYLRPE